MLSITDTLQLSPGLGADYGLGRLNDEDLLDVCLNAMHNIINEDNAHLFARKELWVQVNIALIDAGYAPINPMDLTASLAKFEECEAAFFAENPGAVLFAKEYFSLYYRNRAVLYEKFETAMETYEVNKWKWVIERNDARMNLSQKIEVEADVNNTITEINLTLDADQINVPVITSEQQMLDWFSGFADAAEDIEFEEEKEQQ